MTPEIIVNAKSGRPIEKLNEKKLVSWLLPQAARVRLLLATMPLTVQIPVTSICVLRLGHDSMAA